MLHMHYQFRGSLFIYAGHLHFLVFALGAGLAPWARGCEAAAALTPACPRIGRVHQHQ